MSDRGSDSALAVEFLLFAILLEFFAAVNGPSWLGIIYAVVGLWFLLLLIPLGVNLAWGYPYEDVTLREAQALEYRRKRGLP